MTKQITLKLNRQPKRKTTTAAAAAEKKGKPIPKQAIAINLQEIRLN